VNDVGVIMLPENLRTKLGEDAARELVVLINDSSESVKKQVLDTSVDRYERRLVEVKGDLEKEITSTKADLGKEIANTKAELIKWMFIFWLGQIAVVVGVLAYLK